MAATFLCAEPSQTLVRMVSELFFFRSDLPSFRCPSPTRTLHPPPCLSLRILPLRLRLSPAPPAPSPPPALPRCLLSPLVMTAINVVSIKTHVPVVLNYKAGNFTKWQTYFRATCGKFGVAPAIRHSRIPLGSRLTTASARGSTRPRREDQGPCGCPPRCRQHRL